MLQVCKTYEKGAPCHYLVESFTLDGKLRQRVLFRLGEHSTLEEALEYWKAQERDAKAEATSQYASETVRKLSYYLSSPDSNNPPLA